jgi:hypothetical protein
VTRRFISTREAMQAADTIGYDLSEPEIVREILRCPRDPARRLLLARAGRRRVLRKLECAQARARAEASVPAPTEKGLRGCRGFSPERSPESEEKAS